MGLLFGATGILLNHRAILRIPVDKTIQRTAQLSLPLQDIANAQQMAVWLQRELAFAPPQPPIIKTQPETRIVWGGREVVQPERWTINFARPERGVVAEYFVGNRFVKLDQVDATLIGTLTRLHMSIGVSAAWVLLSDSIAGSLILLSVTGLLLWSQMHALRLTAVLTAVGALIGAAWFIWSL